MKALLGVDMDIDLDVKGSLADFEPLLTTQIQTGDLSNNSTLKQLEIQEDMLLQSLKVKRAANIPSLSASINYMMNAMDETMVGKKAYHLSFFSNSISSKTKKLSTANKGHRV